MTSIQKQGDSHIYYNGVMTNTGPQAAPAYFRETRSQAIIDNPEDWHVSIIRFQAPGSSIPIFFYETKIDEKTKQVVVDNKYYIVTISVNGHSYTHTVDYYSLNNRGSFYIFSYQHFLDMINNAYLNCWLQMLAVETIDSTIAPYLVYDNATKIISLIAQKSYLSDGIQIFMNSSLYLFFDSFESYFSGYNNVSPFKDFEILVKFNGGNSIISPPPTIIAAPWSSTITYVLNDMILYTDGIYYLSIQAVNLNNVPSAAPLFWKPYTAPTEPSVWLYATSYSVGNIVSYQGNYYISSANANAGNIPSSSADKWDTYTGFESYKMSQEYQTLFLWNALRQVVVTTSLIPIKQEFIPSSAVLGDTTSASSNSRQIMTDFEVKVESGPDARSYIQYVPAGEYRLIDMLGNVALTTLDIQFWWEDNLQRLYPLQIPPGETADIKLMFRKKTYKEGLEY